MTESQYIAFLGILLLPPLVAEIAKRLSVSEAEATDRLYRSEFYEKLADERLKLWHYSPVMLGGRFVAVVRNWRTGAERVIAHPVGDIGHSTHGWRLAS